MDHTLPFLGEEVTRRLKTSLDIFRPCKPQSEVLEQNLVTVLAHEFLTKFKDDSSCIAYSEIPFKSMANPQKWSSRLDAYLANSDAAYLVEAKSTRHKETLVKAIAKDLERIFHPHTKESFIEMASGKDRYYSFPKNIHGLIIADFWSLTGKTPWFASGSDFEAAFPTIYGLAANVYLVGTYGRYDYFFIIAQTKDLGWNG